MIARSIITAALVVFAMTTLTACNGPKGSDGGPEISERPANVPTLAQLAAAEARRVRALNQLASIGIIELRWTDESGDHWEQGDIELSYIAPDRTALAVKKLGEIFIWAGSAGGEYWLFDNRSRDASIAYRGSEADVARGSDLARMLHPLLVIDLAGLAPLVDASNTAEEATIDWDAEARLWVITRPGRAGLLRIGFAPETLEPKRVEALDADGQPHLTSRLDRFTRVPVDGLPDGAFPRIPARIEVTLAGGAGTALLVLDQPRGEVEPAKERLIFNFDALRTRLRPARVEPFSGE